MATLNSYVIRISRSRVHYPALLAFWAGVMTESVGGLLDRARSGRKGVQQQNEQDVILKLIPTLNEGLAMKDVPDLRLGCYMLLSVMASKGGLDDKILTAMMEALVLGWRADTITSGLVCLSVLANHRAAKQLTRRLTKELMKIENLPKLLINISQQRRVDKLANGLCLSLTDRLKKQGDLRALSIIQEIIESQILSDQQSGVVLKSLLLVAHQLDDSPEQITLRPHLASTLVGLAQLAGHTGDLVRGVLRDTEVDIDELEMKLQTTIRPELLQASTTDDAIMEDATTEPAAPSFQSLFDSLPTRTAAESSFLCHDTSHVYPDLCRAFLSSTASEADLHTFDAAPILRRETALEDSLYLTFYMRTWSAPHPVLARASALQLTTNFLLESKMTSVDVQAVLPYAVSALSDPAAKVRRAAADLLIAMNHLYPETIESKKELKNLPRWGSEDLYGPGPETTTTLKWLTADVVMRLLREILIPSLEECVLDAKAIQTILQRAIQSQSHSEGSAKADSTRLPQTARASILSFFASHVVQTPQYSVKLRLLASLNQVRSVGSLTRTKILLPVLQQWASLSVEEASRYCREAEVNEVDFDDECFSVITSNDEEGLQLLAQIIKGEAASDRPTLLTAAFKRLRSLWSSLKGHSRLTTAQMLIATALSQPSKSDHHTQLAAQTASQFLGSASLTTDILLSFMDDLPTAASMTDKPPVSKRRRTSHGEVARSSIRDPKELSDAIRKVTFVLQLIDSSSPGTHPELLGGLFGILAEIQHFKAQATSELAYLQGLVLSSLFSILQAFRSNPKLKLDRAAIRTDLLVDCVQKTASPQVQNAALLIVASLADIAPELVLHSVMPIFTFMGNSVLRQNDDYSAHVISQTIREVIPPLISSLRKGKTNIVSGAAELLLSFVAAFEHVPSHRRKGLFTSLVQTLGSEDFLFAILAMLVNKYGPTESIKNFAVDLTSSFRVETQLLSVAKYLDLVSDILKPKPTYSVAILNTNDDGLSDPSAVAFAEMRLLPAILSQRALVKQAGKILERDDMDSSRIRDLYSSLLESILGLADVVKEEAQLHSSCGDILEALLGLLSTSEFLKSAEDLLNRPNDSLRRKILRALEVRVDQESTSNAASRTAMLGFLPQLTAIIRESKDVLYKHTAVACVDKISEKYGKKDLEAVSAAAETIASEDCLGQSDDRLRVMALLCLASLVDILREGVVSILPSAIPKTLEYMELSVERADGQKLHNAGYAFMSALIQHLPYMVSGPYLDRLLKISNLSAEADLDDDADESRVQCLHLAAKQIDAKSLFVALEKNWDLAASQGPVALHEQQTVSERGFESEVVTELEDELNDVAIKMIHKLNDATFRPIFAGLVEWASSSLPKKDTSGRVLRLQSLYGFITLFFDNLKSIVTGYASYLIENAVDILKNVNPKDEESKKLWTRVLQTLVKCFEHDQDDFWQAPAHFSAVAPVLCTHLAYSSSLPVNEDLISAVVELAAAADSSDHHKELNGAILKHMRSESSSVRLAAVQCQQAMTDRLGEEWLSMLPEMLPFISELQEDDDDIVERETNRWIVKIEGVLGESLDSMLHTISAHISRLAPLMSVAQFLAFNSNA
ncbi:putative U3 small nucleolar RNA-associated protein 10 [Glarea lozoyensis 74030]|uniref:U3 small nucleolar RNA-associated protein 10 n=1 Tax=Glarea lozoyensis (strain ATCC 74030 / MF5533) TaxID=1104152 RepID=H0ETN7_GLAL7|nr:putative U3 small nucleolar RNA-associated protein 10 [Glarea lozoyensis 74030]